MSDKLPRWAKKPKAEQGGVVSATSRGWIETHKRGTTVLRVHKGLEDKLAKLGGLKPELVAPVVEKVKETETVVSEADVSEDKVTEVEELPQADANEVAKVLENFEKKSTPKKKATKKKVTKKNAKKKSSTK